MTQHLPFLGIAPALIKSSPADQHLPNGGCDGRGADVRHLHLRVDGLDDAHRGRRRLHRDASGPTGQGPGIQPFIQGVPSGLRHFSHQLWL